MNDPDKPEQRKITVLIETKGIWINKNINSGYTLRAKQILLH